MASATRLLRQQEQGPPRNKVEVAHLKAPVIKTIETTNLPYPRGRCKFMGLVVPPNARGRKPDIGSLRP
jgi:hypothetical protein